MTKEAYYEMCEALGNEPDESDMPLDMSDFHTIVQQCFVIYNILPDIWDTMGGNYMGKDYTIVFSLFDLYGIEPEEKLLCLELLQTMDHTRSKLVADKLKAAKKPSSNNA